MPIYEYQCMACGHEMEKLQKISDQPLIDCPDCKQPQLKKNVSSAGFRLKGTGWYETDFKNKKTNSEKNTTKEKKEATNNTKKSDEKTKP